MPGRIFKRIVESTFPPSTLDLWLRHTKCGAELLYWDENIQRWHAFHYLTFAEEVKGLEELVQKAFDEKTSDLGAKIEELTAKLKALQDKVDEIELNGCQCGNEPSEEEPGTPPSDEPSKDDDFAKAYIKPNWKQTPPSPMIAGQTYNFDVNLEITNITTEQINRLYYRINTDSKDDEFELNDPVSGSNLHSIIITTNEDDTYLNVWFGVETISAGGSYLYMGLNRNLTNQQT